jgi:hypothetical protein
VLVADSRHQKVESRKQVANCRQQTSNSRHQREESKEQTADSGSGDAQHLSNPNLGTSDRRIKPETPS